MTKLQIITSFALITFIHFSCKMKKKYYYKENDKKVKLIEAYTDSQAYIEAFRQFQISKKVYYDIKNSLGQNHLNEPKSFELQNEKYIDITNSISFFNKDSIEAVIKSEINSLPNNIEESVTRKREEKHGKGAKFDTGGLYLAPIKVLKAKFIEREYSNYKNVSLSYKNVSNKIVSAIKFKWYGENAFSEPADMSSVIAGWGGGFTDNPIRPGKTNSGEWNILSRDGKKIIIAYPYEVVFDDGTKWLLESQ